MDLAATTVTARKRPAIPYGLLGSIALVILVERGLHRHAAEFEPVGGCWGESASKATKEGAKAEVLIFGDSLSKFGLQPRVIGERAGLSVYNLAGYAAPPSYDYFLLRRVLAAGGRPRAILINLQPFYSPEYHRRFEALFAEFITPREALDLAWVGRDPGFFGRLLAMRFLPSVHHRDAIRSWIAGRFRGERPGAAAITAAFRRNWAKNAGGHAHQIEPHAPESVAESRLTAYSELIGDLGPSDRIHGLYIRRFLDLAASRDIRVYIVMPPMLPALQARRDVGGYRDHETRLVRSLIERRPNVTVLEGRDAGYDHRLFADDLVHINARGAAALSADVGDLLRQALVDRTSPGRWIDLPGYRERSLGIPLETFAESQVAVRDRTRRR